MANTYTLIEAKTLTTTTASVTFSSIPATYTDLKIMWSGRTTNSGVVSGTTLTLNGSNTDSTKYLQGDGSAAASGSSATLNAGVADGNTATASTFSNGDVYIPNYTSTNSKSFSVDAVTENNATSAYTYLGASLSTLATAITTITIAPNDASSFVQYSTFYLYGIKNS
jgi:hypothetical protein